jgi:hypothetical protein
MKSKAVTLVHKGAMPIAVHAIQTFARLHGSKYELEIHSDGSLEKDDLELLGRMAEPLRPIFVFPQDRETELARTLESFPKTARLLLRGGYFTKLQLPVVVKKPYFFFDSDIVWLRPVVNLTPPGGGNAFSTETWSWYYGACHDSKWIAAGTPRRVNSGFYHISEEFPAERMEKMLSEGMFDPNIPYSTDQEIMAYLFPDMAHYHIDDLKRSRVGVAYDLATVGCAALHFPGGMWRAHLEQIERLGAALIPPPMAIRYSPPAKLSRYELWRMRTFMALSKSRLLRAPLYLYRDLRGYFASISRK